MSTLPKSFVTPAEYLELERKAEYKSEYYNGEIFPMPGVSRKHDRINICLIVLLQLHLKGTHCELFTGGMRVLVTPSGLYTYPDLSVVCGEPQFLDSEVDTLINPTLLIEVLSPTTEDYDRGRKAKMYRAMASVQELLLVAQDSPGVELHRRQADGSWVLTEVNGLDASIQLGSIGLTLRLSDIYPAEA